MTVLNSTLWISLISIVMLFASMAVIWGMMALLTKIPDGKGRNDEADGGQDNEQSDPRGAAPDRQRERKKRAAALAVAAALALRRTAPHPAPTCLEGGTNAWQAAARANQVSQFYQIYTRKPRG